MVCLDTGHHAPGTNIEFIAVQLLRLGKLGSFDFNSSYYADDDLIVGSADPFQLFGSSRGRPRRRLRAGFRGGLHVGPVPQRGAQDPRPDSIGAERAGDDCASPAGRREALAAAQEAHDVLGANGILMDAFYTDVRPALAEWRESRGLPADPMKAYAESDYQARSNPSEPAEPKPAGEHDHDQPSSGRADRPVEPAGSDPKNTNYAGGNTSAKGTETDPVTGEPVELVGLRVPAGTWGP